MKDTIIEAMASGLMDAIHAGTTMTGRDLAQAALTALIEGGYVVVPREPTEAMRLAGNAAWLDYCEHGGTSEVPWKAMVSTFLQGQENQEDSSSREPSPSTSAHRADGGDAVSGFSLRDLSEVAAKAIYIHGFGFREVVGPAERDGKWWVNFAWDDDRLVRATFWIAEGEELQQPSPSTTAATPKSAAPDDFEILSASEQYANLKYAQRLATVAASKFGPPAGWEVFDDIYGALTQIDNALTGLVAVPTDHQGEG